MLTWFSSWMISPIVLGTAAVLVSLPIIIHLLNKRKFKIVDWAAIEFLLDADKRNRRRLRLENLILLLLRCLAVLLLGLLLARPFACSPLGSRLLDAEQFERIVLLDDSLSMQVQAGNQTAMDVAKKRLDEIVRSLAENDSDDTLTLVLSSHPDQFRFNATAVTPDSVEGIVGVINDLAASDRPANLAAALQEVESHLESQARNTNRVVYVISDLRRRDWQVEGESSDDENRPAAALRRVSREANGCFVIDVAERAHNNLVVSDIRPEETLLAGVSTRFDVTVTNFGQSEARDVQVAFTAGDSLPLKAEIPQLAAGSSTTVPFSFVFGGPVEVEPGVLPDVTQPPTPVRVRVEVSAGSAGASNQPLADELPSDSARFFAARVLAGIPTLIVDGDPSASFYRAESTYLRYALAPPGEYLSGVLVKVVTDTELESETLSNYQVIFLCNVYRLSEQRIGALKEWVSRGGGLVIMPGDQVDEEDFNQRLFDSGAGLSPIRLDGIRGDESEQSWAGLQVASRDHQVFRGFQGAAKPYLDAVKVYRWWSAATAEGEAGQNVLVSLRLTDVDESIAMAEKSFGDGRVVATSIPADRDWSTWADEVSYIPAMLELVNYLARDRDTGADKTVGEPLRQPLDLTQYRMDATVRLPSDEPPVNVQATRGDDAPEVSAETVWWLEFPGTDRRGFYEMQLTRNDARTENQLFSVNVEPGEGDLRRIEPEELRRALGDANVVIVSGESAANRVVRGAQQEIWKYILGALVGVLCCEQLLAWLFGRRR